MKTESEARRYKLGKEFYYDFALASEIRHSEIIAGNYQTGELEGLLEAKQQRLQLLQDDIQDNLTARKQAQQGAINKGIKYVEDDRSREKRMTLEARLDVIQWEISVLEEAIEEAEEEKEQRDLPPCLPRGPEGLNQVRGSTGTGYVDGQWCEPIAGVICIVDERSRYRGMAVVDYTAHVSKPWKRACSEQTHKRRKEELAKGVREDKIRRRYTVPWPAMPADIVNHLKDSQKQTKAASKLIGS